MSKYWNDYNYSQALERARKSLPETLVGDSRFDMPITDANIEGNRTFFKNFKEITNLLNRKESHMLKFMTNELGTSGNIEGNRVIFQGKHTRTQIQKALERYVANYVFCATCGKPDTKLQLLDRILIMRCDACGASQAVKSIK
jgi:translation initiation factor 2 subunit 2